MKNILISVVIFSFFATVNAAEKNILFLGDSLTAGYGLTKEQAFPYLIQNKLTEKKIDAKTLNAGISGNTSAGGVRRVKWYFKKKIDVLVLALGANDGLRGVPVSDTKKNLQNIIDYAKKENPAIKIIIAGMKVPPNMGGKYTKEFETIFPEIAKKNNCELIPFLLKDVAGRKKLNLPDGIHPNAEGHRLIAKNIFSFIHDALKKDK